MLARDQIANIRWIMEKAREFQKNIYFCFMDYAWILCLIWSDFKWVRCKHSAVLFHSLLHSFLYKILEVCTSFSDFAHLMYLISTDSDISSLP